MYVCIVGILFANIHINKWQNILFLVKKKFEHFSRRKVVSSSKYSIDLCNHSIFESLRKPVPTSRVCNWNGHGFLLSQGLGSIHPKYFMDVFCRYKNNNPNQQPPDIE